MPPLQEIEKELLSIKKKIPAPHKGIKITENDKYVGKSVFIIKIFWKITEYLKQK